MTRRVQALVSGVGSQDRSGNRKLGGYRPGARPVYATYRPVGPSCPSSCALLGAGCYAQQAPVSIHAARGLRETFNARAWALALPAGALVRWNVSGDVLGDDGEAYRLAILRAHRARPDLGGWLYTHAWQVPQVAAWGRALPENVRCVASIDDARDLPAARALGWRTVAVAVTPADGTDGWTQATAAQATAALRAATGERRIVACPAQRTDGAKVGCADCRACERDSTILFAVHGALRQAGRALAARRSLPVVAS